MANKAYKVVIVEGEDFEVGVFDVINKFYSNPITEKVNSNRDITLR